MRHVIKRIKGDNYEMANMAVSFIMPLEESMPIYEYECAACGHCFERIMKIDETVPACPDCESRKTKKRIAQFRTNAWSSFLDGMEKRASPHKFK